MTKTRIRRETGPVLKTREDIERCVGEIARLTIERDLLLSALDEELQKVRTAHEARLTEASADLDAEVLLAQQWAEGNPQEFADRRSIEMTHGVLGFRTGQPRLKTLKGWTWDRVKERLASAMPEFIRTKQEVDKEALLANRSTLDLKALGVQSVQDETFFVDPKRETPPAATAV